jgi:hypothetical protein
MGILLILIRSYPKATDFQNKIKQDPASCGNAALLISLKTSLYLAWLEILQ